MPGAEACEVQVMVSGVHNDHWLARHNSVRLYGRLLEAGVSIHEYDTTMLHHKIMVVDGKWATIGTANFDNRSFGLNEESNVSFFDPEPIARLLEIFDEDLAAVQGDHPRGVAAARLAGGRCRKSSRRCYRNRCSSPLPEGAQPRGLRHNGSMSAPTTPARGRRRGQIVSRRASQDADWRRVVRRAVRRAAGRARPGHRRRDHHGTGCRSGRRGSGGACGEDGVRIGGVGRRASCGPRAVAAEAGRPPRGEREGVRRARDARQRQAAGDLAARGCAVGRRLPALQRRLGHQDRGHDGRFVDAGLPQERVPGLHAARAGGRGGRDHPVELPADDGGVEDRAGAGHRLQRRPQAGGGHSADGAAAGASARSRLDSRRACSTW